MPNIIVFVQARIGSTRLRGKVLKKIAGREVLLHQLGRIRQAKTISQVVVITSLNSENDQIEMVCEKNSIPVYRGSETDLLDRHYMAAKLFKADFVVKIPSDCPLTDPRIIDSVIGLWQDNQGLYDYVSNYHPPTFPDGLDVEGCTFSVLETAWREARKLHEREHTFPFIWDNPARFRIGNLKNSRGNMFMTHRWTLDYPEDFQFVQAVFEYFSGRVDFSFDDVLGLLDERPDIAELNKKYNGVNWYRNVPGELKTVGEELYEDEPSLKQL